MRSINCRVIRPFIKLPVLPTPAMCLANRLQSGSCRQLLIHRLSPGRCRSCAQSMGHVHFDCAINSRVFRHEFKRDIPRQPFFGKKSNELRFFA